LEENLDVEIFGTLLEEAKEAYDDGIVIDLKSENEDDIEGNCARIVAWIAEWKKMQRTLTD
jgi:adenylate kinase